MPIIGIDLGTTNSLASVWLDGTCQLIPNALGEYLTPSAVSLDDNHTILVGRAAKERLISHPSRTAAGFKRFMGTDRQLVLDGKPFTPVELSAFVLRRIKEDAEAFLGTPVTEAVISVPAYFDDNGRSATKAAGELAGFRVDRIINEPSAAALAYHQDSEEDTTFLVVDFGGGTLDVSIVDAFSGVIEIIAVSGDNHLGGDDFNQAIVTAFCAENNLAADDLLPETRASLLRQAEQCKIALTAAEPVMMVSEIHGKQCSLILTNQSLINISTAVLRRMEAPIARALRDCQNTISEIDDIVLVGGSCHMPVVRRYLQHILGKPPLHEFDADTIVALGTGIAAGIKERRSELRDTLLTDICPFTLGVNIINPDDPSNDLFSPILERNTTLPASRMSTYYTTQDNQKKMSIGIYQGEGIYCKDNLKLGELEIDVPAASRGSQSADVRLTYDINGILQVEVTCQSTGQKNQTLILNPQFQLSEDALAARLAALEQYKLLPRDAEQNKVLLARASRLYSESTGLMREQLHEQIRYFNLLLHEGIEAKLRRYRKEFHDFLDQVDEQLGTDDDILRAFREGYEDDPDDEDSD